MVIVGITIKADALCKFHNKFPDVIACVSERDFTKAMNCAKNNDNACAENMLKSVCVHVPRIVFKDVDIKILDASRELVKFRLIIRGEQFVLYTHPDVIDCLGLSW